MSNDKTPAHLVKGKKAEEQAHQYLLNRGLKPICRNYRCKVGEIDLIMQDGKTLVMGEVRFRNRNKFCSALESITAIKQSRIIAAANCYLVAKRITTQAVRFDVVAISGNNQLDWIQNAFQTSF